MSFVRTLATLAVGFAAAKGVEHFKKAGGMAGLQDAMSQNPALAGMAGQMGEFAEKMGMPGGAGGLPDMMNQFMGQTGQAGEATMAGLTGLMSAMGGAAATGQEQMAQMFDAMTGTTAATDAQEENAKLMIRAMIQAAKADGEIDAEEQKKIMDHLGDVDADELAFVKAELAAPIDVNGLAMDTGEHMKAQVYAMSLMAIRVDERAEVSYLDGLASALGLSDATRAQVHASMGIS